MTPKKTHTLYGGIYETIRHPQAAGELTIWWVMAFLLHSPFLALISFVWVPLFFAVCLAEERGLVRCYATGRHTGPINNAQTLSSRNCATGQLHVEDKGKVCQARNP